MNPNIETIVLILIELCVILLPTILSTFIIKILLKKSTNLNSKVSEILKVFGKKINLLIYIISLCSCIGVITFNGWLIYSGRNPKDITLRYIENLPPNIWFIILTVVIKIIGLFILATIAIKIFKKINKFLCEKIKKFEGLSTNNKSIDDASVFLENIFIRGSWIYILSYSAEIIDVSENLTNYCYVALKVYLIISVGILCWKLLDVVIDSLEEISKRYSEGKNIFTYYERLIVLMPLFRRSIEYILYLFFASIAMRQFDFLANLADWGPRFIKIIGIVFLSRVLFELVKFIVEEVLINRSKTTDKARQSRLTLAPLVINLIRYCVYFGAIVLILNEVGIDPFPIIAGAGIIGLAVGLGAQGLMKDMVSGFSILLENYYLVGDYVRINDEEGFVEVIDISNTRIRDEEGRQHIFKNGDINKVINFSKEKSCAIVDVRVAYECDILKVKEAVLSCNKEIHNTCEGVIEDLSFKGIEKFDDIGIIIRTLTKTEPGMHLEAERQIREILKVKFDQEGIKIPYSWKYNINKSS